MPSLPEAMAHGHGLEKPAPGQRKDGYFCSQCHSWFLPHKQRSTQSTSAREGN